MTIWIVAYEQDGEREIFVQVFHTREEADAFADEVDEELSKLGDGYINTSITEYNLIDQKEV
jgi:hypothetical protein